MVIYDYFIFFNYRVTCANKKLTGWIKILVLCFFGSGLRPRIPFIKLGSASKKWGNEIAAGMSGNDKKS